MASFSKLNLFIITRRLKATRILLVTFISILCLAQIFSTPRFWTRPDLENHSSIPLKCSQDYSLDDFSPAAIRCRIENAQIQTREGQNKQSSTPAEAVNEYKRRYRRTPPAGFEEWVQFALDHGSKIIDNFDQIDRDLEPYRTLESRRLFKSLNKQVRGFPRTSLINIQNGTMSTSTGYMYDDEWSRLVDPFLHALPDSMFYLSTIDEPRVMSRLEPPPDPIQFIERPRESIEDLIKASCSQIPRELTSHLGHEKDVCQFSHPSSFHAFIASPSTFSYTHSLVPMLSFGRMSAFRDILIPCPCYAAHPILEKDLVPFLEKKPALYWRGSSTGGHASRFNWKHGQRERFVSLTQSLQNAARVFDAGQSFGFKLDSLQNGKIKLFKDVFDVHMGAYIQCDSEACKDMERVLGLSNIEPEDMSSNYRYLFDIDGNSMSTRFYRLLSQNAVIFKSTWFQEWHDDRLVPWAHYVPVTMSMEELPSLLDFFINDPIGEILSADIAHSGSAWAREALREIDMSIYIYRLLLEMADIYRIKEDE